MPALKNRTGWWYLPDLHDSEKIFSVTMIPETFNRTIYRTRKTGDIVNIEIDVFAKYVEKLFSKTNEKKDITIDLLKENGFI